MKSYAAITLIQLLLIGRIWAEAPDDNWRSHFASGTKIILTARKPHYYLGENILLDYLVVYDGEDTIPVWTSSGLGALDCSVVAIDADGNQLPASTRLRREMGGHGMSIGRGSSACFTIPLIYYCRLEKPGKYRIRAAHNLGWTDQATAFGVNDPRWAETTIQVDTPDDAQASKVVEQMLRTQTDVTYFWYVGGGDFEKRDEYADFACLRYPVYLPILEQLATAANVNKGALRGIAHNPTPQATQALLRLLQTTDEDRLKLIVASLCDRLPEPKGFSRPDRFNPIEFEVIDGVWVDRDADPQLVDGTWREDFSPSMRQFARATLRSDDTELVRLAAYTLEAIADESDLPNLVATANKLIPIVEGSKPSEVINKVVPIRQACIDVSHAIEALAARGVEPPADPRTDGEIIHFVTALKHRKEFRPAGWENRCQTWVRTESPYVREYVLFNTPRPLPNSLVDTYRNGTRKVIATTHDQTTIHIAVQIALEFEIPVDEILGMLVERMDSEEIQFYVHICSCIGDLLMTGKHEDVGPACTPPVENQIAMDKLKVQWRQFLKEQGPAIRNGKRFDSNSPEFRSLLFRVL